MKSAQAKKNGIKKTPASRQAAEHLRELMIAGLKDIYWAEKALTKALPKMAKNASAPELVKALNGHLTETENQVSRLEKVFELLGEPARAKKCEAMEGLIKEGEGTIKDTEAGPVRDAGIIGACQKVEHYEIATYGTLLSFARILDEMKVADQLESTLQEEKNADSKLTTVAETNINLDAAMEEDEEAEEKVKLTRARSGARPAAKKTKV